MQKSPYRLLMLIMIMFALLVPVPAKAQTATVQHHDFSVDPLDSNGCIGCHDGSIGPNVHFCTANCTILSSHAVFADYPSKNKDIPLHPRSYILEKGIRLVNNQVVCISCHDITLATASHLIIDNTGSKLCLTCHIR